MRRHLLLRALLATSLLPLLALTACVDEEDEPGVADTTWDFAYVSLNPPAPGDQRIHVGTMDGEELQLTFDSSQLFDITPLFSPDGAHLAFQRAEDRAGRGASDVFVLDMETGDETRLTEVGADEDCRAVPLNWNASSDTLAFRCLGDDSSFAGIASLDGTVTLASSEDLEYLNAALLPDSQLLTVARDDDDIVHLRRYNADLSSGSTVATLDERRARFLHVSPNGARAVLIQDADPGTTADGLVDASLLVIDLSSGDVTEHLGGEDIGPHRAHSWHPDNRQVLVSTGGWGNPTGRLFLLDVTDGSETEIADSSLLDHGSIDGAEVSPDGEWIIFGDSNAEDLTWNTASIHLIRANGEDHRRLTGLSVADRSNMPTFNPAAF